MTAHEKPVLKSPAHAAATSGARRLGKGIRKAIDSTVRTSDTAIARSSAKANGGTVAIPTLTTDQLRPEIMTRMR